MRKAVFTILFFTTLIVNAQNSSSPYHLPDIVIWDNDTLETQTSPLNQYKKLDIHNYLWKKGMRPTFWGYTKLYRAEWKINNNHLYLLNIYSKDYEKDNYKADLGSIFYNYSDGLVLADWFTGNLFIPKGKHIRLGASPGFRIFESEWKISVEKGEIISKTFKTDNYYESIYTQRNDSLKKFISRNIDWTNMPTIKDKEKVNIVFELGNSKNNFKVSVKSDNDSIKKEILKTSERLSEFSYYYRHGESVNMRYAITITLLEEMREK
jgi:hypothetical protein